MFFIINGKPHPAERPRRAKTGHFYTPKKTIDAEKYIAECVLYRTTEPKHTGAVKLTVEFAFVRPKKSTEILHAKKPDIDNLIKTVMDGITKAGSVWGDDSQVTCICARKFYLDSESEPYTTIDIQDMME